MAHYQTRRAQPRIFIGSLLLLTGLCFFGSLVTGSAALPLQEVLAVLVGEGNAISRQLVLELRLPRTLSAFAAGGSLALAGALMQILLRNPLADPYILGTAGGAAGGALTAMLLGASGLLLDASAFIGALASTFIVFQLAHRNGSWTVTRLLLTGVVVAAGWGAFISFILVVSPNTDTHGMLFWLMGDLSRTDTPWFALATLTLALVAVMLVSQTLNVLSHGHLQAQALGVNTGVLRTQIYTVASLLTAAAVMVGGTIGFIGLVVPHMLRLVGAHDQRLLLPACVLFGGSFLVVADTVARSIIAPQQLPVGILTAVMGVPIFLYLLNQGHRNSVATNPRTTRNSR